MPMAELKAAYARMGSREVKGKLVLVNPEAGARPAIITGSRWL